MSRAWKILIVAGIVFLLAAIGWEFYQAASGGRSTFTISIIDMPRDNLFSDGLRTHLENDPEFQSYIAE